MRQMLARPQTKDEVMLQALLDHLKGHPAEYVLVLIIMFGVGWQASAFADFWVDTRIKAIVVAEVAPIQKDVADIKSGLYEIQAGNYKRELIEIKTLLCYSPGDQRLINSFELAQEKYRLITGREFLPPDCAILRRPT
jgi:hypothetical protein